MPVNVKRDMLPFPIRGWKAPITVRIAPAEVAEPHRAVGSDCDPETGAENAATREGRPGRAIATVGRLAIGFQYQVEGTRAW